MGTNRECIMLPTVVSKNIKKEMTVVVVLSAMGKYTDELIRMAHDMDDKPPKREMDMLLTMVSRCPYP